MRKNEFGLILLCFLLTPLVLARHPIILVPGDGGSQIEARLDKPAVVHYLCDKKTTEFYNIWLNLELLVPLIIDCWIDNVRLVYNSSSRTTENSPGVEIRVPGFGNTSTVEFLDPSQASPGHYFKTIVEGTLIPLGYSRNVDIRGAPYDFRKAPNEMATWLVDFKALIEETVRVNGGTPAILLCHSMGSPLSLYFLHSMTAAWKKKYVRSLMTLGGVWGGSVKALKVFAIGDDLGSYVLPARTLRGEQRTSPSTAWLLPSKNFWDEKEILLSIAGKRNYTVKDYQKFFEDLGFKDGFEMWKDTEGLLGNLQHPGVEIHCLYGTQVPTVESIHYKDVGRFPEKPDLTFGSGDGTVNIRSLRGCLNWAPKKHPKKKMRSKLNVKEPVYHMEYPGVDHMNILSDPRVLAYLKDTIGSMNTWEF